MLLDPYLGREFCTTTELISLKPGKNKDKGDLAIE
jgi:hypothetical protein